MTTRLVILGLLRVEPLHGYELKHIIEEAMGDWTSIAFGSIYYALGKLDEEGLIEALATEKEGNRPSRTIYGITPAGEDEFLRLLRETLGEIERQYYAVDVALMFSDALPREELLARMRTRVAAIEGILGHLSRHQGEQMGQEQVPAMAAAVFEHSRLHFEAEIGWTRGLLEAIEEGRIVPGLSHRGPDHGPRDGGGQG